MLLAVSPLNTTEMPPPRPKYSLGLVAWDKIDNRLLLAVLLTKLEFKFDMLTVR